LKIEGKKEGVSVLEKGLIPERIGIEGGANGQQNPWEKRGEERRDFFLGGVWGRKNWLRRSKKEKRKTAIRLGTVEISHWS